MPIYGTFFQPQVVQVGQSAARRCGPAHYTSEWKFRGIFVEGKFLLRPTRTCVL